MCVLNSNDYVKLTRSYLDNYNKYMDYVEKAFARCDEIDLELADESIKTTTYGLEQGGSSDLTPVERAASIRMKLKSEKADLQNKANLVKSFLSNLLTNISKLDVEDKVLINKLYFRRLSTYEISKEMHITSRWVRMQARQAEKRLAVLLFGKAAEEEIYFL